MNYMYNSYFTYYICICTHVFIMFIIYNMNYVCDSYTYYTCVYMYMCICTCIYAYVCTVCAHNTYSYV